MTSTLRRRQHLIAGPAQPSNPDSAGAPWPQRPWRWTGVDSAIYCSRWAGSSSRTTILYAKRMTSASGRPEGNGGRNRPRTRGTDRQQTDHLTKVKSLHTSSAPLHWLTRALEHAETVRPGIVAFLFRDRIVPWVTERTRLEGIHCNSPELQEFFLFVCVLVADPTAVQ